eukprot:3722621-Rhodomonas_salina.1
MLKPGSLVRSAVLLSTHAALRDLQVPGSDDQGPRPAAPQAPLRWKPRLPDPHAPLHDGGLRADERRCRDLGQPGKKGAGPGCDGAQRRALGRGEAAAHGGARREGRERDAGGGGREEQQQREQLGQQRARV